MSREVQLKNDRHPSCNCVSSFVTKPVRQASTKTVWVYWAVCFKANDQRRWGVCSQSRSHICCTFCRAVQVFAVELHTSCEYNTKAITWNRKRHEHRLAVSPKVVNTIVQNFLPCSEFEYNERGASVRLPLLAGRRSRFFNKKCVGCGSMNVLLLTKVNFT